MRNDLAALERLASESSVFEFKASGNPPAQYSITFNGKGLCRDRGKVRIAHVHHVEVKLGASYPRTMPEIRWLTPIYHPNISEIGMVCLGGYGTHWVPSVQLDELCQMLWDMARYHNYDIRSPYNRDAALWVANQTSILFPTDGRPIRDVRIAQGRAAGRNGDSADPHEAAGRKPTGRSDRSPLARVRNFIERYGRSFEAEGAAVTSGPTPRSSGFEAMVAGMTGGAPAVVDAEPPRESMQADPSQGVPAVPSSTVEADGFVFLQESDQPAPPPSPPASSADEEILFIE
ncbi:MAG: ubiquitin-conjugating enzyme E2 [Isosphaeraceae bacterium]